MNDDIIRFLFEESQVREELEGLSDDLRAFLEKESEELKVSKTELKSALDKLKLNLSSFEIKDDTIETDDESAYTALLLDLSEPDAIAKLAEFGWVAASSGDTAAAAEAPKFKVNFIEICVAGDEKPDDATVAEIVKKAVEFATTSELPKAGDKPGFKPSKSSLPGVGKAEAGTVKDSLLDRDVSAVVQERARSVQHVRRLTPDTLPRHRRSFGKIRRVTNRPKTL